MTTKNKAHKLGQYFTTNIELKRMVNKFILNNPDTILETSCGQGDLVSYITKKHPKIKFDMYEIDDKIKLLETVKIDDVIYGDFLEQTITKKYKTIIGNPPYIKTRSGNLYIDFIKKCFNLLETKGELIFIVPSDFLKLTCATKLLSDMIKVGTITHLYHPNDEKLFENASIDIIIFRYCKDETLSNKIIVNDTNMFMTCNEGMVTFTKKNIDETKYKSLKNYFDAYVGIVSGKESVFKNDELGNVTINNGIDKQDKYILINKYPSENDEIDEYLLKNKKILISRSIRKFTEKNWFEFGALRNIKYVEENINKDCIYVYNLTRKEKIAYVGKIGLFGGGLIMIVPKNNYDLKKIVDYLNSDAFKNNFMFSGRFKIGHRQLCSSQIKISLFNI